MGSDPYSITVLHRSQCKRPNKRQKQKYHTVGCWRKPAYTDTFFKFKVFNCCTNSKELVPFEEEITKTMKFLWSAS